MWIFLRHGFCSVKDAGNGNLLARFRTENHAKHVALACGGKPIRVTGSTDYKYRIEVSRDEFAEAMKQEIAEIDYPNFKDSISSNDPDYADALHSIWGIHHNLQRMEAEK
jgi:hypothetical protein